MDEMNNPAGDMPATDAPAEETPSMDAPAEGGDKGGDAA